MTGIFFEPSTSRIYYTLSGQSSLFYRSFLPESHVIGAIRYTATGDVGNLNPSRVRGMFLAGGQIWFGDNSTGNLLSIGFANGVVTGTATVAERHRRLARAGDVPREPRLSRTSPPTAAFTSNCAVNSCTLRRRRRRPTPTARSPATRGTSVTASWAPVIAPVHAYAVGGTYTVTLTVTDSDGATSSTQQSIVVTTPPGTGYVSLPSPARILDTRPDGTTIDGLFAATGIRPFGSTLELSTGGRAGMPGDVAAVVLNITVTEAEGEGFLTVFPCGAPQPTASNLNYVAGQTVPNLVVAKVGAGGAVCIFNGGATHVLVDVAGYFPGVDAFTPLAAPARLLDTRPDGVTVDGLSAGGGLVGAGHRQTLQVTGRAG